MNASIAEFKGMEAFSVYIATKTAVRSFAQTWTMDLRPRKISVNTKNPGPINRPAVEGGGQSKEQVEQLKKNLIIAVPMIRSGITEEIAKFVSFLASDDSSYITGIDLSVDEGMEQI